MRAFILQTLRRSLQEEFLDRLVATGVGWGVEQGATGKKADRDVGWETEHSSSAVSSQDV